MLESGHSLTERETASELPLFSTLNIQSNNLNNIKNNSINERLLNLDVNKITPLEALTVLSELVAEAKDKSIA